MGNLKSIISFVGNRPILVRIRSPTLHRSSIRAMGLQGLLERERESLLVLLLFAFVCPIAAQVSTSEFCTSRGGIHHTSGVCCSSACDICGGDQCSSPTGGASNCCPSNIIAANRNCDNNPPPCVISFTGMPSDSSTTAPDQQFAIDGVDYPVYGCEGVSLIRRRESRRRYRPERTDSSAWIGTGR